MLRAPPLLSSCFHHYGASTCRSRELGPGGVWVRVHLCGKELEFDSSCWTRRLGSGMTEIQGSAFGAGVRGKEAYETTPFAHCFLSLPSPVMGKGTILPS